MFGTLVFSLQAFAGGVVGPVEGQVGFGPPVVSPDGRTLALTRWDRAGLQLYDLGSWTLETVTDARGAGFAPTWSPQGWLTKIVDEGGQAVVRTGGGELTTLDRDGWVGQPFLDGGAAAWTSRSGLRREGAATLEGVGDVDLVAARADGALAWDDDAGVLHVRDAAGEEHVFAGEGHGSHPAWSHDGRYVLHATADGTEVFDVDAGALLTTLDVVEARWVPGRDALVAVELVTGADLGPELGAHGSPYEVVVDRVVDVDLPSGRTHVRLDSPDLHPRHPAWAGATLVFVDGRTGALVAVDDSGPHTLLAGPGPAAPPPPPSTARNEVWVPYMHQLWDTPDDFDGNWSCGPTSCVQTLATWSVLPDADITCSWPSSHTSHWGWYIPNNYSFNGYTYDTWGVAAGGDCQGAHGFICREYGGAVWSYMVDFMSQHGVGSAEVGTSYDSVVSEEGAGYPMYASVSVLGYGHILVVRGYVSEDGSPIHTLVVNDPYGNAGTGDWGNDDGEDVVYDWPGYNNGNLEISISQLFTAHGTAPADDPPADTGTGGGGSTETPPVTDTGTPAASDDPYGAAPAPGKPPGHLSALDEAGGCASAPSFPTLALAGLGVIAVAGRRRR